MAVLNMGQSGSADCIMNGMQKRVSAVVVTVVTIATAHVTCHMSRRSMSTHLRDKNNLQALVIILLEESMGNMEASVAGAQDDDGLDHSWAGLPLR